MDPPRSQEVVHGINTDRLVAAAVALLLCDLEAERSNVHLEKT